VGTARQFSSNNRSKNGFADQGLPRLMLAPKKDSRQTGTSATRTKDACAAAGRESIAAARRPIESRSSHMKSLRTTHAEPGASRATLVAEGVIEAGWLVALVVVPLFFNVYSVRSFEPDKVAVFRSIVFVMISAWLLKLLTGGRAFGPSNGSSDGDGDGATSGTSGRVVRAVGAIAAVLAVWIAVTATLSIDVRVGWLGSYTRFSGALTQLAFVAFFALVATHLRTRRQWQRASYAIVLAATATAGYALLQALDLDPRWFPFTEGRVYSSLGNPIFLAAYLAMTIFITALVVRGLIMERRSQQPRHSRGATLRLWVIVGAGALQFVAILLSQSRGPLLGLLVGTYLIVLVGATASRGSKLSDEKRPGSTGVWWGTVIATGVVFLAFTWSAQSESLSRSVEDVPVLGRISSAFDIEASPGRLEIWRSVTSLIGSAEPIQAPGGPLDGLARVRPLIGYGPDTLELAIGRHITDELAALEAVPDRAHNATFDVIAMHGVVGYALWVLLYGAIVASCLLRIGLIGTPTARRNALAFTAGGAVLGVGLPALVTQEWALSGLGLAVGAVVGLAAFVTMATAPWRTRNRLPADRFGFWLTLAILGAVVAHVIEIHFGILVTPTRLMFWFLAAVAVSASSGHLYWETGPTTASATVTTRRRGGQKSLRAGSIPEVPSTAWDRREALILGWLISAALAPFSYSLMINERQRNWFSDVLVNSLGATADAGWDGPGAYFWIVVLVFGVGAALLGSVPARNPQARLVGWGLRVAGVLALAYAAYQAFRLAAVITRQQTDVREAVEYSLDHFSWFMGLTLLSVLVIGGALGWQRRPDPEHRGPVVWRTAAVALVVTVGGVAAIVLMNVAPIRADTLAQQGVSFGETGADVLAIEALDEATRVWPGEPRYWLLSGQVTLDVAARSPDDSRSLADNARLALENAARQGPLDPDHRANLARYWVGEAGRSVDASAARELLEEADKHYRAALVLYPKAPILLRERVALLRRLGRVAEADELAARLVRIEANRR
jgi:MFS family permease